MATLRPSESFVDSLNLQMSINSGSGTCISTLSGDSKTYLESVRTASVWRSIVTRPASSNKVIIYMLAPVAKDEIDEIRRNLNDLCGSPKDFTDMSMSDRRPLSDAQY
ncbi:hypothetical protein BDR03DRAFT_1019053 [Suillus americanus]|nr:hypothetical protein BDR03DRAFT_1019053 [Suillus americanus]